MSEFSFELLQNNIEICVSKEHKFGTDAFLLADFAKPRHKDKVCDLGTGCGIIPLLMKIKFSPKELYGVDIQAQAIEQFDITVEKNGLENIHPVKADLKELWEGCPKGSFDVVTCNPPYKAANAGIESLGEAQKIARHEILCNINDVCRAASRLLKFGGRLCICNRPERLADVICAMRENNIEPKLLRFVSKTAEDASWLFLIEGRLGGKPFMKVIPPLFVQDGDGFSKELLSIYGQSAENN
ncbi:MAG: methyltransferase [Oscillospiraceae bacterium]|nr:methyltransferase [Oscillospiraceae bacterium]